MIGFGGYEGYKFIMDYGLITDLLIYERQSKTIEKLREEFDGLEMYYPASEDEDLEFPFYFIQHSISNICDLYTRSKVQPIQAQGTLKSIKFSRCIKVNEHG